VNPTPDYCDGRERKPLPEINDDDLICSISKILDARSRKRIHLPLATAESLEKLRDQLILKRRMSDWSDMPARTGGQP